MEEEDMEPPQKTTRIHVTNLPFAFTNEELKELFSTVGTVAKASIVTKPNGDSKGFGFVEYDTLEASAKCVEELNNQVVKERRVGVVYSTSQGPYVSSTLKKTFEDGEESPRLHVRELAWGVKRSHLEECFGQHGNVLRCRVVKNKRNGRSKGYGFLEFEKVEEARAAKEAMDGEPLEGRPIVVLFSKSEGPRPSARRRKIKEVSEQEDDGGQRRGNRRVFVGNLSENDVTTENVQEYFESKYGPCDATIPGNKEGRNKPYAFVTFETHDAANAALGADGEEFMGNELKVVWVRPRPFRGGGRGRGRGRRRGRSRQDRSSNGPVTVTPQNESTNI